MFGCILREIVGFLPTYELLDWIDEEKLYYNLLSRNHSYGAIKMLMKKKDKIDWYRLTMNPNPDAFKLLMDNVDKINWDRLSENPNIFTPTYNKELLSKFE